MYGYTYIALPSYIYSYIKDHRNAKRNKKQIYQPKHLLWRLQIQFHPKNGQGMELPSDRASGD